MSVMFVTANTIYSQTDWQSHHSETPLPKKAKLKTVKYKTYNYAVTGYVLKKQFVEGQEMAFYGTNTNMNIIPVYGIPVPVSNTKLTNPIISGTYFVKDGISYLESTIKKVGDSRYSSSNFSLRGVFRVTNSFDEKRLTAKTKEAKELKIKTEDIIECLGFYRNSRNPVILQKDSNNNYLYKIKFDDRILEAVITKNYLIKDFFPVVDNLIKNTESSSNKYGFPLVFDNHLKSLNDVKLTYNNGDFFIGKVDEYNNADEGKYLFSNGEIFIGKTGRYDIWIDGEWKFTDGSIENGNWLEKYDVTSNELSNATTLTDKHNLAINIYEEKQRKLQEERIAKQQAEEKRKIDEEKRAIAEQKRKQEYIEKYGEYYGLLISKGQLELGMTQAMVREVWDKDFFIISKSVRNGKSIEIWEYSKDKMEMAIIKSSGGANQEALATLFLVGLSKQLGGPTIPQMIIFTNNKLTDVYR